MNTEFSENRPLTPTTTEPDSSGASSNTQTLPTRSLVKEVIDFLFDPNTGCCNNPPLLEAGIGRIVARNGHAPTKRSQQDIWEVAFDKPFYSNVQASVATRAVSHARSYFLSSLVAIQSPGWLINQSTTKPYTYSYKGTLAHAATTTGIAPLLNSCLMHPCTGKRLWRVRQFAVSLGGPDLVPADNAYTDWLHVHGIATSSHTIGWMNANRNGARNAGDPFIVALDKVPGFAYTTACHIAADLGYPVYKMDTWIRAAVVALPEVFDPMRAHNGTVTLPGDLLNPERQYSRNLMLRALDELVDDFTESAPQLSTVNLGHGFNRLRVADFVLAHIGMQPEPSFGLVRRPLDVLNPRMNPGGLSLRQQYPKLAAVVQNMIHLNGAIKFPRIHAAIINLFPPGTSVLRSGHSLR